MPSGHRVATSPFNAGADLRAVQQWFGHIEASSTRAYDHADRAQIYQNNADLLEEYYLRVRQFVREEGDSNPRSHRETA